MNNNKVNTILEALHNEALQDEIVDMEAKSIKLPKKIKDYLNSRLYKDYGKTYLDQIPLREIIRLLQSELVRVLQEDGTPWSGFLTGDKGSTKFDIAYKDTDGKYKVVDCYLIFEWYKIQSGKFEINTYIS